MRPDRALDRLTGAGEDARFLDAIADISRQRPDFPTGRRAILAVLGSDRQDHGSIRTDAPGDLLRDSGASLGDRSRAPGERRLPECPARAGARRRRRP